MYNAKLKLSIIVRPATLSQNTFTHINTVAETTEITLVSEKKSDTKHLGYLFKIY
jgi:hypothetical protein